MKYIKSKLSFSTMEFDHYAVVPQNVAQTIIEARTGGK
ncbi:MAG: hypothetical protein UW97_C0010G0010 [Parcubacteria group bacterium GW2011_GWA2_45_15]|nr:MAG: hypothetical protein UW97_C0010G0010 [Parcubacteria group bacterium GW2011_GWA2_45_15]